MAVPLGYCNSQLEESLPTHHQIGHDQPLALAMVVGDVYLKDEALTHDQHANPFSDARMEN